MKHTLKDQLQYSNALPIATIERFEKQRITLSGAPSSGSFKLSYGGSETAAIEHDEGAAEIQAALRDIEGLENVTVTEISEGLFEVHFVDVMGDVALLSVVENDLDAGAGEVDVWVNDGEVIGGSAQIYDVEAQSASEFIPTSAGEISEVSLIQGKLDSPNFDVVLEIWSSTSGAVGEREPASLLGASDPVAASGLTGEPGFAEQIYAFPTPVPVLADTVYWAILRATNVVQLSGSHGVYTRLVDGEDKATTCLRETEDDGETWSAAEPGEFKMIVTALDSSPVSVTPSEQVKGVGSNTIYSNAVDLTDFQSCALIVHSNSFDFDETHKALLKVEESDDSSTWNAVPDSDLYDAVESEGVVKVFDHSSDAEAIQVINYRGGKQFLRVRIDFDGILEDTGETSLKFSVLAVKGHPMAIAPLNQVV